MSRPRTKGHPILIRMPIALDEALAERAVNAGCSKPEMVARMVTLVLEADQMKAGTDRISEIAPADMIFDCKAPCKHPRSMLTVLNGGLGKCRCGAIRNAAGEWRDE